MFDLEKLALLVTSRMGPLLVEHQRCSRVRSPLSKCSRCLDICPIDALSFDHEGISIDDTCLECGLCAGVCPTDALGIQEPTELALLDRLLTIGEQGGTAGLGCRQESELNPRGASIPCIGSLSQEFLLTLDQAPFPIYFILASEKCEQCKVVGGGEHALKQLAEARETLKNLGLKGNAIKIVPEAPLYKVVRKKRSTDPGRRAFFQSVFTGAKQVPQNMLQSVLQQSKKDDASIKAMASIEVSRLRLLKQALASQGDSTRELELLAQPKLQGTCHFCRACVILCPVGALKCTDDYQLLHEAGRCTGCGLCTEICLHKSLTMDSALIKDFCQEETILIAQGTRGQCDTCGQEMIASDAKKQCFICERKAEWQAI